MFVNIEIELDKIKNKSFNNEEEKLKELENLNNISSVENSDLLFEIGKIYFFLNKYEISLLYLQKSIKSCIEINESNIFKIDLLSKIYIKLNKLYFSLRLLYRYRKYFIDIANEEIISLYIDKERYDLVIKYIHKYMNGCYKSKNDIYKYFINLISRSNIKNKLRKVYAYSKRVLKNIEKNKYPKFYNSVLNELEIAQRKVVLKSYPRRIIVLLTSECNIRCKMCAYDKEEKHILSKKQIDDIIRILPYLEAIEYAGGEPLLYKNLIDLLDIVHKHDVKQTIISNGLLINDFLAEKFIKYDIGLTLSIDSVYKDLYEKIRVGAKFDLLIKNIEKINFYSKKLNKKVDLSLGTVLSKWNYEYKDNFYDTIKFAKKYDFNKIVISIDRISKDKNIIAVFNKDKQKLIDLAKELDIEIVFNIPSLSIEKKDSTCFYGAYNCDKILSCLLPFKQIYIHFDSCLKFGCFCDSISVLSKENNGQDDILSIKKLPIYDSIEDFWNGKEIIVYRNEVYNNKLKCNSKCYLGYETKYNI